MPEEKTRTDRFDEAFKTLLIIVSLVFSGSLSFYRETWLPEAFVALASSFLISIVIYVVTTLHDGNHEYVLKIFGWYFLMFSFGIALLGMIFPRGRNMSPMALSALMIAIFTLTFPISRYLQETIGHENYKRSALVLAVITTFFVVLDILTSLH